MNVPFRKNIAGPANFKDNLIGGGVGDKRLKLESDQPAKATGLYIMSAGTADSSNSRYAFLIQLHGMNIVNEYPEIVVTSDYPFKKIVVFILFSKHLHSIWTLISWS
jgi:hypothetical protein